MKVLNYIGLTYLIDKLKSFLVKKEIVNDYLNNIWMLWMGHGTLSVGDTLPKNSMLKFMFLKRMENDGAGNPQYAMLDEVTVPSWVLEQMTTKKIWSSSNGFFSINAHIEFNESLTVTNKSLIPIDSSVGDGNLYVKLYYRALNPKGDVENVNSSLNLM